MFGFGGMGGYPGMGYMPNPHAMGGMGGAGPMFGSPYDPLGMMGGYQKKRSGSVSSEASTVPSLAARFDSQSFSSSSTPRSDVDGAAQPEAVRRAASDRVKIQDSVAFGQRIGEGDFSVVYRGTMNGRPVAIKVIDPAKQANRGRNCRKDFDEEVAALRQVHHPGCLELLQVSNLTIVTDLAEGQPLKKLLYPFDKKPVRPPFAVANALKIMRQLAAAVAHLHAIPLLHRDIKPENIIVSADFQTKLIDFGMAMAPTGSTTRTTFDGSPLYGAPEALGGHPATCKSEVWTLACVCAECFGLGRPYSTQAIRTLQELAMKAQAGDKPFPVMPGVPANAQQILQRCFTRAADSRPDAADLAQV